MGVRHVLGTGTYLGLPSLIGRSKKATFGYIKDKIWRKINSWRGRPISKAGKKVMIKSVLQSIPSYVMGLFILLDGIVSDIEKMLNSFWWGGSSNNKGIRWMSWDRMTGSKNEGGLGFRDLKSFNMAMVAKRGWHLLNNPDSLVSRVFKARWSIGDGRNISVMGDPWLRGCRSDWVKGPQNYGVYDLSVNALLSNDGKQWNGQLIRELFDSEVVHDILQTPLVGDVEVDKWVWKNERSGCCRGEKSKEDRMVAGRVAVLIDTLWRNRNNLIWNNESVGCSNLGLHAFCSWQEWFMAQEGNVPVQAHQSPLSWNPPVYRRWKCNVDAGFNTRRGTTNRGWCFRDHLGNFVHAGVTWDFVTLPIIEAEALALKEAIQVAIELRVTNVIFESDSQITVNAIRTGLIGTSEFSSIISSICILLLNFPNFEVKFVKRQANSVAHALAKAADSWTRRSSFNFPPPCIEPLIINDMS
ncbi:uncharacterized protein LOC131597540 [Vicia villosa]|uniref:uncharacterized protein LOC131597540 n=1 Tax=Vicia villosa TaxID=3911 RepID=UPI00273AEEB5|nr:uncharacterized protein LOC131597540 [Vicia villosa]